MRMLIRILLLACVALAVVVIGCSDDKSSSASAPTTSSATTATAAAMRNDTQGGGTSTTAAAPSGEKLSAPELVKRVRPSVVKVIAAGRGGPFGQANEGSGTGFIIDDRGYIVTNNHVVTLGGNQPASRITVELADGRRLEAKLVGRDDRTDIAVLKIDADRLTPLKFADPRAVEVGEEVIAVGFPLDLGATPTVTRGVVSALDREIQEQLEDGTPISITGAIQTDAAVNPGNSGGPLLNMRGEVIGINTAGLRGGLGRPVEGISFAVSAQVAQPIVKTLLETGTVQRGYLGVGIGPVDRNIAQARNLPVTEGAILVRVEPGSAAERAGLRAGDVLTKIGDTDIKNVGDITLALTNNGPGTKVKVEYYRGSERRSTEVTLGERPSGTS